MLPLELLAGIAGAVIPQVSALVRSIWGRKNAQPEKVLGDLAANNPDKLPAYIDALGKYFDAQARWFNRDMVMGGTYPVWLLTFRGVIRPAAFVLSVLALGAEAAGAVGPIDKETRAYLFFIIGNWLGDRASLGM